MGIAWHFMGIQGPRAPCVCTEDYVDVQTDLCLHLAHFFAVGVEGGWCLSSFICILLSTDILETFVIDSLCRQSAPA